MSRKLLIGDVTGAFADLGTLLPLMLGLIVCNHLHAASVFAVVGITYIAVGAYYRLPVPVQLRCMPCPSTSMTSPAIGWLVAS